ncbi:MAG: hypothetical protein ACF8XB_00570 [Planctomycetota bacterium JB042]
MAFSILEAFTHVSVRRRQFTETLDQEIRASDHAHPPCAGPTRPPRQEDGHSPRRSEPFRRELPGGPNAIHWTNFQGLDQDPCDPEVYLKAGSLLVRPLVSTSR